jgi:hypothetical protein
MKKGLARGEALAGVGVRVPAHAAWTNHGRRDAPVHLKSQAAGGRVYFFSVAQNSARRVTPFWMISSLVA